MDKKLIRKIAHDWAKVCCNDLGIDVPPIYLEDYNPPDLTERGKYECDISFDENDNFDGILSEKIVLRPNMFGTEMQVRGTVAHECRHAWQARHVESFSEAELSEDDAREWARDKVDSTYRGAFHDVKIEDKAVWIKMGDEWYIAKGPTKQLEQMGV